MESILVTGGAGFIGSNFVRLLMQRYPDVEVHVLDAFTYAGNIDNLGSELLEDPNFNLWRGNICDPSVVSSVMARVDTVVHFAAESHVARSIRDNDVFFDTDVMGTKVIANEIVSLRRQIKRFVHISTSEVYGTAIQDPMDENHPLNPRSPYAAAKCGADRLVHAFVHTHQLPAVILRPFNQFGPHQHVEKCIPRFITAALMGEPLTIHGDGSAERDWVYVKDTCHAVLAALEAPLDDVIGEVINIGTGQATDVLTIAHMILELTGGDPAQLQHIANRPAQVQKHISSTNQAKKLLGWQASMSLEGGIKRTVAWYRKNLSWWLKRNEMKHVAITLANGNEVLH